MSPRGSLALYKGAQALAALRGRDYAIPEDVKELAVCVCAKRVIVRPEQLVKGVSAEEVLALDAILAMIRKGGDARIIARQPAAVRAAAKIQRMRINVEQQRAGLTSDGSP